MDISVDQRIEMLHKINKMLNLTNGYICKGVPCHLCPFNGQTICPISLRECEGLNH